MLLFGNMINPETVETVQSLDTETVEIVQFLYPETGAIFVLIQILDGT